MKLPEYIIARTFFNITDELEKERKNKELKRIKDSEEKYDKGYWKYSCQSRDYKFVEPKKNEHFKTLEINDQSNTCKIILSKKPINIESYKYDYPWDAEAGCKSDADFYRKLGYKITIQRDAPLLIADFDICCPYCFNSSPFEDWTVNSYKQEMLEVPDELKRLNVYTIKDKMIDVYNIKTEKLWCPICQNGVNNIKLLMRKGDEWKADIIKGTQLPTFISPFFEFQQKEQQNQNPFHVQPLVLKDREVINEPFKLLTDSKYRGLVVKVIEKKELCNGDILKTKWLPIRKSIPDNCVLTDKICTSYAYDDKLSNINKRNKNEYPIIYMPLSDLSICFYDYTTKCDNKSLEDSINKFHAGELLPYVTILSDKLIYDNYHLIKLAMDLKLSHVPVIIAGINNEKKINLEKQYRDGILTEHQ